LEASPSVLSENALEARPASTFATYEHRLLKTPPKWRDLLSKRLFRFAEGITMPSIEAVNLTKQYGAFTGLCLLIIYFECS